MSSATAARAAITTVADRPAGPGQQAGGAPRREVSQ
jgi:hypothetical protein